MNASQKIAGFTVGLVVVFAAAFGIGSILDPIGGNAARHAPSPDAPRIRAEAEPPAGLSATEDGYTLELLENRIDAGRQVPLRFRITDPSGVALTRYIESHEKQLHLIVVRRDMTGYQHVHPTLDDAGTWSVPVDLSAGIYRVYADFMPAGGEAMTLGADLHVAGRYAPRPLPPATSTATVDGYTVTMAGTPKADRPAEVTLSISRGDKPVTDLQPYLGAYGHLVALRASDLAYLHVHPMGEEPGDSTTPAGPDVAFGTTFPSTGDYRLFLDFKHQNIVHTTEFTVSVDDRPDITPSDAPPADHGDGH